MADHLAVQDLIETRGKGYALDAFVVAVAFERAGGSCAFALGDGSLRIAKPGTVAPWRTVAAHAGVVLAVVPDAAARGFICGGDDGALRRISAGGEIDDIARFGSRWVEHVAAHPGEKGSGTIAAVVGREVHLFGATGNKLKTLQHPSTATGIAFDRKGKRIAASHYNGASLWFVAAKEDRPRSLEWKGSHIAIAIHPEGDAVITAMQDNALHGWGLLDGKHMQMSGYPGKTESLSFSRRGKWLATSGAEAIVVWPFFGGGPMGKPPLELAGVDRASCTRVACHPEHEVVAGGYSDGRVLAVDIDSGRVLPVAGPGHGAVSALAWSPDGRYLALGTEDGFAAIVDFSP